MPSPPTALFELGIVIPLYNEEIVLPELVRRVQQVLSQMALPAEVPMARSAWLWSKPTSSDSALSTPTW